MFLCYCLFSYWYTHNTPVCEYFKQAVCEEQSPMSVLTFFLVWDKVPVSHCIHRIHQVVSCKSLGLYLISTFHLPGTTLGYRCSISYPTIPGFWSSDSGPVTCVVTAYPLSHCPALNWNTLILSIIHVISLHMKIICRYKW